MQGLEDHPVEIPSQLLAVGHRQALRTGRMALSADVGL